MKGSQMLIDSPFEVDRKPSRVPGRFPDSRIIELEQPSQGFPQWRLLLQLSAFTVAGPCRIFTGFPIKRESHQTAFFLRFSTPLCQVESSSKAHQPAELVGKSFAAARRNVCFTDRLPWEIGQAWL